MSSTRNKTTFGCVAAESEEQRAKRQSARRIMAALGTAWTHGSFFKNLPGLRLFTVRLQTPDLAWITMAA
jgi:hypothetical protein